MAFDRAIADLDTAAAWIFSEADKNKQKNSQRMNNFKSDILMFCTIYNHHLNQGDFDQHPEIKKQLSEVTRKLSKQVRQDKITVNDVFSKIRALYTEGDVLKKINGYENPYEGTFHAINSNEIVNDEMVKSLSNANRLLTKNKLNDAEMGALLNSALGKPVDTNALGSLLLHSNNFDTKQRKIFRQIAVKHQDKLNDVFAIASNKVSALQQEMGDITHRNDNPQIISAQAAISSRNDSAGILKRKYDYYQNNNHDLKPMYLVNAGNEIHAKYNQANNLAHSITTKRTQVQLLNELEKELLLAQKQNNSIDSLRKKGSSKPHNIQIKEHTKAQKKEIEASLMKLANMRSNLQMEIRAADKQAVRIGNDLIKMRREMISSALGKDSAVKITPPQTVALLAAHIKCELEEKKDLINLRIQDMKSRMPANDPRIKQQEINIARIESYIGTINNVAQSKNNSLTKLNVMENIAAGSKSPMIEDIKKSHHELYKDARHNFKRLDHETTKKIDQIRDKVQFKSAGATREVSINHNLQNLVIQNKLMLEELNKQADFTDDPVKNQQRRAKYENSNEMLVELQKEIVAIQKNPTDQENRARLEKVRAHASEKNLPDSTKKVIKELHGQLGKLIVEEKKKSIQSQQKTGIVQVTRPKHS